MVSFSKPQGGPCPPRRIRPALHGGVTRSSRFSEFLGSSRGFKDASTLTAFVWPSAEVFAAKGALQAASPQILASLASVAAALGGADSLALGGTGVSAACIPFLAPGWGEEDAATERNSDGLSQRARHLQTGLAACCFAQACVATLEFALNDGISGLIGCCIATLGMQAASPTGYRFLPSYIVLAFTNGTMQVLVSSELAASHHLLSSGIRATVGVKLAAVVALASPAMMFIGLAVAWHLHCELRAIALQALPPGMRGGGMMSGFAQPPVDGVVGAADSAIGQGNAAQVGPFRAFQGQPHRLLGEVK